MLILPSVASAANTYVNETALDNSGTCLTPETACRTIGGVDGALSKSGPGDITFVADGTYAESIVLGDGKSLLPADGGADPDPVIDNGADLAAAITVDSSGAGMISGFTIRSDYKSLDVMGTVTIQNNRFDEDTVPINSGSDVTLNGGASIVVNGNTFVDPDAAGVQWGLETATADEPAPVISNNTFTDLSAGVLVQQLSGGPQISGNTFAGARPIGTMPIGDFPGAGVLVLGAGDPTITGNTFNPAESGPSAAVYVESMMGFDAGAALSRNRISGYDAGVQAVDSTLPVTLSNDLVYKNDVGLAATDSSGDSPPSTQGDIDATNATIFDNVSADVMLDHTTLTLDSSVLGDQIDLEGTADCVISFSRGPAGPTGNGCDDFATNAAPQFVDPTAGDFHLLSTSPLIDAGNPADPGFGAVDFYGASRMVLGAACNAVRRDIGAAEFQPGSPPECAQDIYADVSRPNDLGDCTTLATACKTIEAAVARAADDQTIHVAEGTYAESVNLDGGKSLVALDSDDPRPLIDSGTDPDPAVRVDGEAGTVSGLRIRSDEMPMLLQNATVEVSDNVFDGEDVPSENTNLVISGGSGIEVHDNVFVDPNASGTQFGVSLIENDTDAEIFDNDFTGLAVGVVVAAGSAEISGNEFSATHPSGMPDFPGAGVFAIEGEAVITGNVFEAAVGHPTAGVYLNQVSPVDPVGAVLSANRISGHDVGVQVIDTTDPVTLGNDLIYDNTTGLDATDSSTDDPTPSTQGDVSGTNLTIFGNAVDASVSFTTLALDSSILGTPVDVVGDGACSIANSRGSSSPSSGGCSNFATNADPQFVDAAGGDFHLQPGSGLIDLGNPADPGPGVVDFFGAPRAVQGKPCSTARRDIGAAEYQPAANPGCPPAPPAGSPPVVIPEQPVATLDRRPSKVSSDRSPTFEFSSDIAGSRFRCRLDKRAWKPCTPPVTYFGVKFGKHRFRVYAIGPDGLRSRTRIFKFTVVRDE